MQLYLNGQVFIHEKALNGVYHDHEHDYRHTMKEMKEQLIEQARKAMTIKGKLSVSIFDDLELAFVEL